jgi:hypothetical protein
MNPITEIPGPAASTSFCKQPDSDGNRNMETGKTAPNPCPRCGDGNGPICSDCWAELKK